MNTKQLHRTWAAIKNQRNDSDGGTAASRDKTRENVLKLMRGGFYRDEIASLLNKHHCTIWHIQQQLLVLGAITQRARGARYTVVS